MQGYDGGKGRVCTQVETETNDAITEVVSCFKCLGRYFSKDEGSQDEWKTNVGES